MRRSHRVIGLLIVAVLAISAFVLSRFARITLRNETPFQIDGGTVAGSGFVQQYQTIKPGEIRTMFVRPKEGTELRVTYTLGMKIWHYPAPASLEPGDHAYVTFFCREPSCDREHIEVRAW
jgi:hypothetical protein